MDTPFPLLSILTCTTVHSDHFHGPLTLIGRLLEFYTVVHMPYGLQGKKPLITLASASSIPMDDKTSGKTISVNTARITAPTKDKEATCA
jgi:hypothetical protein